MIFPYIGKIFILLGVVLIFLGLLFFFDFKIPFLGRLPGDILIKRKNLIFYFPITSLILVSLIISIVLRVLNKK